MKIQLSLVFLRTAVTLDRSPLSSAHSCRMKGLSERRGWAGPPLVLAVLDSDSVIGFWNPNCLLPVVTAQGFFRKPRMVCTADALGQA